MTRGRPKPTARPAPPVYQHPAHPGQLIARERRYLVMWPAEPGGWTRRRPFAGAAAELVEADLSTAIGTGWHRARADRAGRRPRGATAATVHRTVKLTEAEAEVQDAAAEATALPWASWARERLAEACDRADGARDAAKIP